MREYNAKTYQCNRTNVSLEWKKKKKEKEEKERKKNRKIDTKRGSQYHIRVGEQSRGTKSARCGGASIHETTHCRAPWWTLNAQEARTKLHGWSSLKWKPFWRTKRRTPLKRWEWRFGKRGREMKGKGREGQRKLDYRINVYLPNELAFNGLFENCAK